MGIAIRQLLEIAEPIDEVFACLKFKVCNEQSDIFIHPQQLSFLIHLLLSFIYKKYFSVVQTWTTGNKC